MKLIIRDLAKFK